MWCRVRKHPLLHREFVDCDPSSASLSFGTFPRGGRYMRADVVIGPYMCASRITQKGGAQPSLSYAFFTETLVCFWMVRTHCSTCAGSGRGKLTASVLPSR